jgi:hypothetical protein
MSCIQSRRTSELRSQTVIGAYNLTPCDADGNELVFLNSVDSSASDSGYLELDTESLNDKPNRLKLEKWILTAIEERLRKNNVLVVGRIVKMASKKA